MDSHIEESATVFQVSSSRVGFLILGYNHSIPGTPLMEFAERVVAAVSRVVRRDRRSRTCPFWAS